MKAYHFKYCTLNRGIINIYTIISNNKDRAEKLFIKWTDRVVWGNDAYLYLEEIIETDVCDTYEFTFSHTYRMPEPIIIEGKTFAEVSNHLEYKYNIGALVDIINVRCV